MGAPPPSWAPGTPTDCRRRGGREGRISRSKKRRGSGRREEKEEEGKEEREKDSKEGRTSRQESERKKNVA